MKTLHSIIGFVSVFSFVIFFTTCKKDENPSLEPVISTNSVSNITQSTAYSGGNVISDNGYSVTARGVCWSTNPDPTINDSKTLDGAGGGNFESQLNELTGGTKYYLRAYATNIKGTGYGMAMVFNTLPATIPQIESVEINRVNENTISYIGNVVETGGSQLIQKGFCWGLSHLPTIEDNVTMDGTEVGAFSGTITGLDQNSIYYFRAYATNSLGTAYGQELSYLPNLAPNIQFITETGYISSDTTLQAGELFKVLISATSNSISGAKIVNLKVVRTMGGNAITVADETIDLSSFTSELSANTAFIAGIEQWTFSVTDANSETSEISLYITTTAGFYDNKNGKMGKNNYVTWLKQE